MKRLFLTIILSLITTLFLIVPFGINEASAQVGSNNYISKLSYFLNVKIDDSGEFQGDVNLVAGTIKYEYNQLMALSALTVSNKINLDDVSKINIEYTTNKISVTNKANNTIQNSNLDNFGRLSTLSYSTGKFPTPFPYEYKLKYSSDGHLERVSSYGNEKLKRTHELTYQNGNLVKIENSFYNEFTADRTPDYYFEYYDEPAIENWNLEFSFLVDVNVNFGKCFLFGFPGKLLGKQSKRLLKTITVNNKGIWQEVYAINYKRDEKGMIKAIIVKNRTSNSVFAIDYL